MPISNRRGCCRFALAVIAAVLLAGTAPAMAAGQEGEGAGFRHGINVTRLFDTPRLRPGPARDYDQPPFKPWRDQLAERELDALRAAGFDFIRLPIDPGPLLALPAESRRATLDQILEFVATARTRRFAVLLDLHTRPDSREWNAGAILQSLEGEKFARYEALVGELAGRLALLNDPLVALEPFNEPQRECVRSNGPDWPRFQERLVARARTTGPDIGLVVTGGCWSSVDGLATLDPSIARSGNIYLMIHFYEPHAFTHQGASWSAPARHLAGLDFPISPDGLEIAAAATERAVGAAKEVPGVSRDALRATSRRTVDTYFKRPITAEVIRDRLKIAADWADRAGLARDHVLVGEFGVLRWGGLEALPRARQDQAKAAWLRAVVEAAGAHGFGWAVWGYDGAFGIVSNDAAKVLEPFTLEALFPRR